MNEYAMLHIPDSRYCFATGEKELVLRLRMAKEDEKAKVFLIYAQKYDFTFWREKQPMEIKYSDKLYNYYEIFIFFFPCLWLILASFSKSGTIYSFEEFFQKEYSLASFQKLFTDTSMYNYPQWFFNTLFVAAGSCILGTFLTILTAYTMSRFEFKARKPMMKTTMVLGMFPSFMGMTAVYLLMTQFNLINHLWGLILIYSAGAPMGYLTQKGFFDTIPKAIDEAARIDGATNLQVFTKINLPLSKPMIVYTALTSFTWPWSDFILPKLLLKNKDLYTVAVGLMSLDETEFARFAAGSVFIAIPNVILYFCLVKNMVNGMAAGAVKG